MSLKTTISASGLYSVSRNMSSYFPIIEAIDRINCCFSAAFIHFSMTFFIQTFGSPFITINLSNVSILLLFMLYFLKIVIYGSDSLVFFSLISNSFLHSLLLTYILFTSSFSSSLSSINWSICLSRHYLISLRKSLICQLFSLRLTLIMHGEMC